ncbi:DUF4352 domain-containing protein [Clostridium sp.]|uniref:DUF4352 domain-containing protein n=1 Tax=Clostridium sp. TaxID=1506 RepID=UPI0032165606
MEKLKSIITNKITIGILCFILGGIIFGRTSGVDITQERYSQLLEMEKKVLAANTNDSKEAKEDNTNKDTTKDDPKESTEFKVGETAYLTDANGVKVMSLTIDGAKLIEERNSYSDKQADKVVEIDYTYENIGSEENLNIFSSHFKIYDASGNVLETYPSGGDKHSQAISKGKKCNANMSFALNNESNELEIEFYENMYNSKPTGTFKITCE